MKIRKVIIPAAGLGTRFLPATKAQPKEMLPIVDKPTIQYIVEEAVASGAETILIITGRNKRAIEDHFDKSVELEEELSRKGKTDFLQAVRRITELADIHYIRQKEPLGLGHAVYCARHFIGDEPFAVMLGDDVVYSPTPCLAQLMAVSERYGCPVLGVQPVAWEHVSQYGIVRGQLESEGLYRVEGLVEKPSPQDAPSNIAILGRYIITPDIFPILADTKTGSGGEIQLTDALARLAQRRHMAAYCFEGRRYDVGSRIGFLEATVEYALRRSDIGDAFERYLRSVVCDREGAR
ncbi:MAG: UTP--glucose-1-phosphate uridylyltransferase GalU [Christensenellales bacterium]|jgi:UTP--glucose-1-phosphate uridylyltransferase